MALTAPAPMDIDLNDVDRRILAEIIEHGRATNTLLADVVGVSRPYVVQRVRRLLEHGILEEVAPQLYDASEDGRRRYESLEGGE